MKNLLRCFAEFQLPDDFSGSVPDALRLFADYLEANPTPPDDAVMLKDLLGGKYAKFKRHQKKHMNGVFKLSVEAEKRGHRAALSECAVLQYDSDTDRWGLVADELADDETAVAKG